MQNCDSLKEFSILSKCYPNGDVLAALSTFTGSAAAIASAVLIYRLWAKDRDDKREETRDLARKEKKRFRALFLAQAEEAGQNLAKYELNLRTPVEAAEKTTVVDLKALRSWEVLPAPSLPAMLFSVQGQHIDYLDDAELIVITQMISDHLHLASTLKYISGITLMEGVTLLGDIVDELTIARELVNLNIGRITQIKEFQSLKE